MPWVFLHLPDLALEQALRLARPDTLAAAGHILLDAREQAVLRADAKATRAGIRPGQTLPEALALSPQAGVLVEDPAQTAWALERLALVIYRLAGRIALHPPQGLLVEADSMRRLVDSSGLLQTQLQEALVAQGHSVQASRGHSPLMARVLAEQADQPGDLDAATLWQNCAALPLHACGLPAHSLSHLQTLGLRSAQDVLALPSTALGRRFGTLIQFWQNDLRGQSPTVQQWFHPPERFQRKLDLDMDAEHTQGLQFPLRLVLADLETFCRQTQQCTDQLLIRLHHRERPPTNLTLGSALPEFRADTWLGLLRLRLEQLTLFAPVRAVWLRAARLMPLHTTSGRLMPADTSQQDRHAWISRLTARLGDQAVYYSQRTADYRPEQQNRLTFRSPDRSVTSIPDAAVAPLWLLPEPEPLAGSTFDVLYFTERIQSGWWDLKGIRRDYYQARLADQRLAWVFQRADGQWFLAGLFS